jgi:CTP:molybdopterin cytidylyltransferase MocA
MMKALAISGISALLATAAVLAVLGIVYVADAQGGEHSNRAHAPGASTTLERTEKAVEFRNGMRALWEDHIVWTRQFIVSFAADQPDLQATTDRLLANQEHIGDAVKPFYGEAAGDALTQLLREHILGAAALLAAAKSGDSAAFDEAHAAWYANGEEIAVFLNGANPENWPLEETSHHMTMHLDLTLQEAAQRLGGQFEADIASYDTVHEAILEMADFLSVGIIRQFPDEFRGPGH